MTFACAGMCISEEVDPKAVLQFAQWKQTLREDHQKKNGKKHKVGESSRQAPMVEERSNSSIIIISPLRKVRQAEATEVRSSF